MYARHSINKAKHLEKTKKTTFFSGFIFHKSKHFVLWDWFTKIINFIPQKALF